MSKSASYQDKYGQWHVEPCINGEPSGNDGLILSAYAKKLGMLSYSQAFIGSMVNDLKRNDQMIPIERIPNVEMPNVEIHTPTPSRDFFLGFSSLVWHGLFTKSWNFCPYALPKFNLIKFAIQAYKLYGKHRNTMWQESGYEQVWHVGYMIPLWDRAYHQRSQGRKVSLIYKLIEYVDSKLKPSSDSSALLRWLKYNQVPDSSVFDRYFGVNHPITIHFKDKYERFN